MYKDGNLQDSGKDLAKGKSIDGKFLIDYCIIIFSKSFRKLKLLRHFQSFERKMGVIF